jgi:prefoldin subunit 5
LKKCVLILFCLILLSGSAGSEDFPDTVKKPIKKSITVRQDTQKAEDRWAEEKATLETQFEALQQEQEELTLIRDQLRKRVDSYKTTIASLENKITEISRISGELLPYLEEVFDRMANRIDSDLPFLQDERRQRLKNLRKTLDDPEISSSEKFRKTMEALFIETEYGNTVEVYQQRIMIEGKSILVDIFRLGRISLFFQSLDQTQSGYFNQAQSVWKTLPAEYNREINAAIEIGTKRRSADLLNLPVGRIVLK